MKTFDCVLFDCSGSMFSPVDLATWDNPQANKGIQSNGLLDMLYCILKELWMGAP